MSSELRGRSGRLTQYRMKGNPNISPTIEGWDADACYKPFAIYDRQNNERKLWYNGRHGGYEQVGLATKKGKGLGF